MTEARVCEQLAQSCYSTVRQPELEPATIESLARCLSQSLWHTSETLNRPLRRYCWWGYETSQADTNQVCMMECSWSSTCVAVSRALGSRMSRLRINETVAGDTRLSL